MYHTKHCLWILAAFSAACGNSAANHPPDGPPPIDAQIDTPPPPIDAAGCTTAQDCPNGSVCNAAHQCVDVAGSLSGLLWKLPCDPPNTNDGTACATTATTTSTTVAGTPGVTYDVTVRLRGVVEQRTYPNGCSEGYLGTGGDTGGTGDPYNIYKLTISSPLQTYYVNSGSSNITQVFPIDYSFTFRADAGATVTLSADPIEGHEIYNHDSTGTVVAVVDGTGLNVTQPYDGQFVQLDVTAIAPDPVASNANIGGGTPGNALQFSDGRYVQVADAASLQPATGFTLEGWISSDDGNGDYQTMLGRTVGSGNTDSYTVWYDSGLLNAGASNATYISVPWTPTSDWHHIAFTTDATGKRLYIDGQLSSCAGGLTPTYDAHPVILGADVEFGIINGWWHGRLDELRIFSAARTSAEIWADFHTHRLGATANLVGEWTFDEGSGQSTADSSGTGNVGQLGDTTGVEATDPTWVTSTAPH